MLFSVSNHDSWKLSPQHLRVEPGRFHVESLALAPAVLSEISETDVSFSRNVIAQGESQQSSMNEKKIPTEEKNPILRWRKERQLGRLKQKIN